MKKAYRCQIIANHNIAEGLFLMTLAAPQLSKIAQPGQFIHIKIPGNDALLLRRPISINGVDMEQGYVDIVYQIVGQGTRSLTKARTGDYLDILGPLGRGFEMPEDVKSVYLVGGGCGVAPIKFVGERWREYAIKSFLGFRNKDAAYQLNDFEGFSDKVFIATDDGSLGEQGFIVNILAKEVKTNPPDMIIACGPVPMLKVVQDIASQYETPCQISLEERMGCGIGGCLVCNCAIKIKDQIEYKRVCFDGPVFWSQEVVFGD